MYDQFFDDRMFVVCVSKYIGQHIADTNIINKEFESIKGHPFYTNQGIVDSDGHRISLFYEISDEDFSIFREERFDSKWGVLTFRNLPGYPTFRSDVFDTEEETISYFKKVAPQTPLVSLEGHSPNPTPTFHEFQEWCVSFGQRSFPY